MFYIIRSSFFVNRGNATEQTCMSFFFTIGFREVEIGETENTERQTDEEEETCFRETQSEDEDSPTEQVHTWGPEHWVYLTIWWTLGVRQGGPLSQ